MLEPRVLIMKEPTAVLDTPEREALSRCIASLSPRPTILMASPAPPMKRLADHVIQLTSPEDAWHQDANADAAMALKLKQGGA